MAGNFREYRNRQEMVARGWTIASRDGECRNCHAAITWTESPNGKKVPLDVNSTVLHFKSCSNGGAPAPSSSRMTTAPAPTTATTKTNETTGLRESLDECAQAV